MTRTLPYPEFKVSNDKRFSLLELTTRCAWVYFNKNNKDFEKKIDPNKKTLQRFLKETNENDDEIFRECQEFITPIIDQVGKFENPISWSKTTIIPLIYLCLTTNFQRAMVFISTKIEGNDSFFEIGWCHNASTKRCKFIIEKYNEYWNSI